MCIVGYVIGILWGLYFKINIVFFYAFFMPIYIILCKKFDKKILKQLIIIIIVLSSISKIYIDTLNIRYEKTYETLDKKEIKIIATIVGDLEEKEYNFSCKIKIENINGRKYNNLNMLLKVKKEKSKIIEIKYGDKIEINGTYEMPGGQRNYKGFDYAEYLKTKKIYGIIKTELYNIKKIKENNINIFFIVSNSIRNEICKAQNSTLTKEKAGLLNGILIGYVEDIEEDMIQDFKDSSLAHILAVSGTHVIYILVVLKVIFNKSKTPKITGNFISIFILCIFMFITNFTSSVVRAAITAVIILLGEITYKKPDVATSIAIPLFISLIYNPFLIKDIGLLLSYGGTIAIIILNKKVEEIISNIFIKVKLTGRIFEYIINAFSITLSVQILIFPILIFNFNNLSLTFFVANILITPIIGPITILGFLNITRFFLISSILSFLLEILIKISEICSRIPFSNITVVTPNIFLVILYYLFLWFILYKFYLLKKYKNKIISVLLIICMILAISKIIPKDLKIYFIDVGQRR